MDIVDHLRARPANRERGAALVEYSLLLALVAIVCILALTTLGEQAVDAIVTLGAKIAAAGD